MLAVRLDVNDEKAAFAAVGQGIKRFGRIDVLANNAGYGLLGAVAEASQEEIENLFRTNVFGLLAVTRATLPHMRRQRSGHIINISSIGGFEAFDRSRASYCVKSENGRDLRFLRILPSSNRRNPT
ncbi:SDR family NAD(P)-dependent oxidoreductase [Microbulbifer magnicolonia]|uniref:SDR family NAD(P)-dependent oxidoreductase n=1 Tax=Microbulbifer magnicolonia TaxID=3109744 RepID=UPI003BF545FA